MRPTRTQIFAAVGVAALLAGGCSSSKTNKASGTTAPGTIAAGATTSAPSLASAPGVTATQITVGNVSVLTGPVPGLFQGGPDGVDAYFQYVNSQGGVNGRKLVVKSADDALTCASNLSATQSLSTQVFAFVGNWSTFDNCGAKVLQASP